MGIQTLSRKTVGLLLGPVLLAATCLLDLPMSTEQQRLLAVILMTITYWISGALPIPMTSVLALALAVVLGVAPAKNVFGAFSSPVLFLLIGGFILTNAMSKHGLGQRLALSVLIHPLIGGSTYRMIISFGALAVLLSAVIDNGAVSAMLLPVGVGVISALSKDIRHQTGNPADGEPLRFATALMLITAYGSTVGALLTPFGDASNLVGWTFIEEHFGVRIPIFTWMGLAVPIVVFMFAVLSAAILILNKPEIRRLSKANALMREHRRALGPMSQGEANTAVVFGCAVFMWMLPPAAGVIAGQSSEIYHELIARLSPPVVAIIAAASLFILPVSRKEGFTLRWRDIRDMDWGPVLLMGSALALGRLMAETGLAHELGDVLAEYAVGVGPLAVYMMSAASAILLSELTSNLVSISVLVPLIPSIASAGGGDTLTAALTSTFAAIYGFMLPISTSANAIVYSSGQIPFTKMLKTGLVVDVTGVLIVVGGLLMMKQLIGIPG